MFFLLINHVASKQIHLWEVLSAGVLIRRNIWCFPKWKLAFQIISEFQFSISKNLDLFSPSQSLGDLPWCFNFLLSSLPHVNRCLFQCFSNIVIFIISPKEVFLDIFPNCPLTLKFYYHRYIVYLFIYNIFCVYLCFIHTARFFLAPSRARFYHLGSILPPLRVHSVTHSYEFSNNVFKRRRRRRRKRRRRKEREGRR